MEKRSELRFEKGKILKDWSTVIALVVIWAVLAGFTKHFLTVSNFSNMFLQAANIILISIGMTFVLISGQMDLSCGAVEAFAGALVAVAIINYKIPMYLALPIGILIGVMCGLFSGLLITKFAFPPFIATLGMQSIARGAALIITGGTAVFGFPESFKFLGQGFIGIFPFPVIIFIIFLVIAYVVLRFTRFGVNVYATGGNSESARLSGINVNKIKIAVMVISGALSALGGIIMTSRLNSGQATIGQDDVMDVIAAVVIGGTSLNGGTGTIRGTIIGVLIITSIRNGLNILGVTAYWQQVAIGFIIIGAILIDHISKGEVKKL